MNKLGQYLQQHVSGEVTISADARRFFATDASIFTLTPSLVVYPRSESDVRKVARFTWQLAERGRVVPITARGGGSDQSGAALGSGVMMVFPAHLNRVLEFDSKSGVVVVEPGINYGTLQQMLHTHGRFLPPFPASLEYSTVGGAVANNAAGVRSVKYGPTRSFVKSLRVVLANGETITTGRLTKRELSKKLGLATFEGEVYRGLDTLLEEHKALLGLMPRQITKNSAGYDLPDIRHSDGSFDLTPLFVGSQGTLGIVTEVTLDTEPYNPETTLLVATFGTAQLLQAAVTALRAAHVVPSAMEMVDGNLLTMAETVRPGQLKGVLSKPYPAYVLLVEYDDTGRAQKRAAHKAQKILHKHATEVQMLLNPDDQDEWWKVRQASAAVQTDGGGRASAVPLIEDAAVPIDKLEALLSGIRDLYERNHLQVAVWGHAGDANLHLEPILDMSQIGDRQTAFRLMEEYYKLVISLDGTTTGQHGDGRLRGPYLPKVYGPEVYELFEKVKRIFDPHGTLNPGVKVGVKIDDLKPLIRSEYSLGHLHQYAPRS